MAAIFKAANTAVITGGASGIGLAVAKKCAGYGMRVLVADWDTRGLDAARSALGPGALAVQMDVGKLEDWARLRATVSKEFGGQINLLALNAGVGLPTPFTGPEAGAGAENFRKTFDTNLFGVVNGITTLLPLIQEKTASAPSSEEEAGPEAAIVITGSKQGITNPPGSRPAYNASKAAVKSLAESLSFDLRGTRVAVHLLVPGWTWTALAGASSSPGDEEKKKPDAPWWPEQVADYLEAKIRDGQFWVMCPDNEVSEEVDRKRMLWNAQDVVKGRPPLSRWRDEYKDQFEEWMKKDL
ncbi:hypothetical protein SLS62_004165 [Diatrype stigma]|uniref:Uncharacterized protein n=1 Tax=Diatrype stigma TaxID=117547 RepID=A0AAN9YTV9_9PEZI